MSIRGIIIDSLKYPFSNWTLFLFLGIVILISFSPYITLYLVKIDFLIFICLSIIGFLFIGSFVRGYLFKIISESLNSFKELPAFNNLNKMFIDGIKILIVNFIYLVPAVLIVILLFYSGSDLRIILAILSNLKYYFLYAGFPYFIPPLIALIYLIMIIPVMLMAIANMAYNNGKLSEAFKFDEIFGNVSKLPWERTPGVSIASKEELMSITIVFLLFDEISERILNIYRYKLIIWYIATGIISLALILFGYFIANFTSILILNGLGLFSISNYNILQILILSLVFLPYLLIFLSRSTALIYNSAIKSYLIRENCI